jgi:hypothetical protein
MDHTARAAPWRPEVDQHRLLGVEHLGLERSIGHVGELPSHFFSPDRWLIENALAGFPLPLLYKI